MEKFQTQKRFSRAVLTKNTGSVATYIGLTLPFKLHDNSVLIKRNSISDKTKTFLSSFSVYHTRKMLSIIFIKKNIFLRIFY